MLPILMDMAIVPIQALRVAKAVQMYEKAAAKSANLVTRCVQSSCPRPPHAPQARVAQSDADK